MRSVLLMLPLLAYTALCSAKTIEQVYAEDGSVYYGYISEQVPGKYVSIYTEKAVIVLPTDKIKSKREDFRSFSELTESAKSFFRSRRDTTYVKLYSFEYDKTYYDDAFIIEEKDNKTKFWLFANKTYKLDWKQVTKIVKDQPLDASYGIQEIITLKNGLQYTGFINEQIIGKSIIFNSFDKSNISLSSADMISCRYEPINQDSSLWKQLPLLDVLEIDGGKMIEGFIVSKVMNQSITIKDRKNTDLTYNIEEVTKYRKTPNTDYVPLSKELPDLETYIKINDVDVDTVSTISYKKYLFVTDTTCVAVRAGDIMRITIKNMDCDKTVGLYKASKKSYSRDSKNKSHYLAFSETLDPQFECNTVTSEDGIINIEYKVRKKGFYFVSINGKSIGLTILAK